MLQLRTYLGEAWDLDMHSSPETRPQVGWAGEDVAKVLIPHEFIAILLDEIFHL